MTATPSVCSSRSSRPLHSDSGVRPFEFDAIVVGCEAALALVGLVGIAVRLTGGFATEFLRVGGNK
jgi:hypothetical protein